MFLKNCLIMTTTPTAYGSTLDFLRLVKEDMQADDGADFEDAKRGFIGTIEHAEVLRGGEGPFKGQVVWSHRPYAFLDSEEPAPTVNPSLWRQARLNLNHGLYKVTDRIYQVRGFDIANITLIEGDTGLIALDALSCADTAKAALALYRTHRDPDHKRLLHTVMYSHSHADHFGGVRGLVSEEDVFAGRARIIAPSGFMHHAIAENVIAGVAMARRGQFQFGPTLPKGVTGQVDSGLGKNIPLAQPGLIPPTQMIEQNFETHTIDGVEIEFQLAPDSEAPSEMHFYFPGLRALNMAENTNHTMHNLCPLRGAQVRDSLAWSKYLNHALHAYAGNVDVLMGQHHWPTWGTANVEQFLSEQRDLYRVMHDQTVRMMNHGLKPAEIAETMAMPKSLAKLWHARGYYGTLSHNIKAVYQRYLSWYDAHPANLHALPPVPAAQKTIEYMGGIEAVLAKAQTDFDKGEYRWVAQVMRDAVYAYPEHQAARALAASTLEQMGFQAESATWRNAFLLGAHEYRHGTPKPFPAVLGGSLLPLVSNQLLFDALAVRWHAVRAEGLAFKMAWQFTDAQIGNNETWLIEISNGAMNSIRVEATAVPAVGITISLSRATLQDILQQKVTPMDAAMSGQMRVTGDPGLLRSFFTSLDKFVGNFPVVDAATLPE
jgi:alkyl sulfatase BDS1-like metallo-beta-lactamase superfamily hydrolase